MNIFSNIQAITAPNSEFFLSIGIGLIFIIIISFTYQKVNKDSGFKLEFSILLSVLILITTMIIKIIQVNMSISLGLVGILSMVRFRVKIKDLRDVGFLLWAVGIGVAIGTGNYIPGFAYTIIIAIYFILNSSSCFIKSHSTLIIRAKKLDVAKMEEILSKNCDSFNRVSVEDKQNYIEYIYNIDCKKEGELKDKLNSKLKPDLIFFV